MGDFFEILLILQQERIHKIGEKESGRKKLYFLISFFWKKNSIFEEFTISKSKKIRAPLSIIAIFCYPQTLVDFLLKLKSKRRRYSISNNCGCKEPSPFLPFFVVKAGRETHHRNSRWYRNTFGYYYGY